MNPAARGHPVSGSPVAPKSSPRDPAIGLRGRVHEQPSRRAGDVEAITNATGVEKQE
jgi:hypothetical protein